EKVGVSIKESKGKGASVTIVVDLTHSSPLSPQSLPSRSGSHSVGDSVGESSSNLVAAKRHKGNDSVSVPACTTTAVAQTVSTEAGTVTASAFPTSSSRASLSVQCVDLLGVKLHPCSARLVYDLFSTTRAFAKKSCSRVLSRFLSDVRSEISTVRQAVIWCRTYKKLHLLGSMAKFLCTYHSKYRPDFIRSLANTRVLSSSSDCSLVPLSGRGLLSFLSKLDCAIGEEVKAVFNLEWDELSVSAFAGLEDGSLSDIGCADLINILYTVTAPVVVFSISKGYEKYQRRMICRRRDLNKSKTSGGGASSPWTSLRQIRTEPKPGSSSTLGPVIKPVGMLTVSDQPSSVSAVGTVSTVVTSPDGARSSLLHVKTVPKKRVISESKISGSSGKRAEGTEPGSLAIDVVRSLVASLPRLEPRHGLSSRSESSSKRRLLSKMQLGSLSLSDAGSDQSPGFALFCRDQSVSLSSTDTVSTAVALPKGDAGSSSSLAAAESVAASTVSDKPAGVSTT
ncbi:hypothetical protein, partial [Candidatus Ichthyocystis sparus]